MRILTDSDPKKPSSEGKKQPEKVAEAPKTAFVSRQTSDPTTRFSGKRISLKVDQNGEIQWSDVSEDTKKRLSDALQKPGSAEILGLPNPTSTGVDVAEFSEDNIRAVLNVTTKMSGIGMSILSRALGAKFGMTPVDVDIAINSFKLSDEADAELTPRGTRLANKYSNEFMKKYADEIAFAGMFVYYMGECSTKAAVAQSNRDYEKKKAAAANKVASVGSPSTTRPDVADKASKAVATI